MMINHQKKLENIDLIWSADDCLLLQRVSENPSDILTIKEIHDKISGSQLTEELIRSFLDADGMLIFTRVMNSHLQYESVGELEVAALYEVLLCCKIVMNSSTGMDYFLKVPNSIETIVNCLNFCFKMLALQVLEILSVCCYYSNVAAISVFKAFQVRGETTQEAPMTFLCAALIDSDVETKTAIMKFVNTMLAELQESDEVYQDLLTYLQEDDFEGNYQEALNILDSACEELAADIASPTSNLTVSNLSRVRDEKCDNDEDSHDREVGFDRIFRSNHASTRIFGSDSHRSGRFGPLSSLRRQATRNLNILDIYKDRARPDRLDSHSVEVSEETEAKIKYVDHPGAICVEFPPGMRYSQLFVCPDDGSMAGSLTVLKSSKFLFGTKTKIRWFYLDGESLKNLHFSDNTNEGCLAVANVLQIRSKTTDINVSSDSQQSFEIETYNGNKHPFGCSNPTEKARWLAAFHAAKACYSISISSYKKRINESTRQSVNDILNFSDQFRRQGALYTSIVEEKRQLSMEDLGFNGQDISEVSNYLHKLLLGAGFSGQLLQILQECVLLAPGDKFIWDTIRDGIKKLRKQNRFRDSNDGDVNHSEDSFCDMDEATYPSSHSFSNQLNGKVASESNSLFAEMSRLALMAMTKEQENKELKERIVFLEEQVTTARSKGNKTADVVNSALEKMKMSRLQTKVKQLEEYFANDQSKIAKLEEKVRKQEDDIEDLRTRNRNQLEQITDLQKELDAAKAKVQENMHSQEAKIEPFGKYKAMLKVLHETQVRHRMSLDGVHDSDIDAFLTALKDRANLPPTCITEPTVVPVPDKFEKYRKMQKNRLPEGAVRQSMQRDGFKEDEILDFLEGRISTVSSIATSSETEQAVVPVPDKFEKYRKMQKNRLPEGAVRQSMQRDGFKEDEILDFLEGRSVSSEDKGKKCLEKDPVKIESHAAVVDPSLEKFRKMLTLFPEAIVRHKMSAEGLSAEKINSFFNPSLPAASIDASKFDKYKKMKAILPENVIRHKMQSEGCTAAEIDAFLTAATKKSGQIESPPDGMPEKIISIRPPHKLKPFYWEKIKPAEVVSTVFYKLPDFSIPDFFVSILNELYVAKAPVTKASEKAADQIKPVTNKLASVVDAKRVQTVLIVMSKLKLEPEEVMKVVVELNPEVLTADVTVSIKSILPTDAELSSVQMFSDPSLLDRASRLVFHLNRVPHLVTRLHCHEIPFSWFGFCSSVFAQLRIVQVACDELREFQGNMQSVLAIVLSLGNYLNVDTKFGGAYGFKLDTVLKLETVKDGKSGSLLHLLAALVQEFAAESLNASEKWTAASAAARISIKEAIQDIDRLEEQVKKMRGELLKISDDETNRGLDGTYETMRGSVTFPLFTRLSNFLVEAEPKLYDLRAEVKSTQEKVSELMKNYGESFELEKKEDDSSSANSKEAEAMKFKFFFVITTFFRKLRAASEDNLNRKKAAEKASKRLEDKGKVAVKGKVAGSVKKKAEIVTEADKENTEQPKLNPVCSSIPIPSLKKKKAVVFQEPISGTSDVGTRAGGESPPRLTLLQKAKSKRSGPQKNIFGSFHSDHESTTDAVLTEFIRHPSKRGIAMSILESLGGD